MTQENLKKEIDNILKKKKISTTNETTFNDKIKIYEIILEIENKTGLLVNVEKIFEKDCLSYNELLDIFYKEYERERRGY